MAAFANLRDTPEQYRQFANQWPTFFPIRVLDMSRQGKTAWDAPCVLVPVIDNPPSEIWVKDISWDPACFGLALTYRDCLRDLWAAPSKDEKEESLQVLLGIDSEMQESMNKSTEGEQVTDVLNMYGVTDDGRNNLGWRDLSLSWLLVLKAYPKAQPWGFPSVWPLWGTGDFAFEPDNDFQRAVYLLFRESWRAKICARCNGYFIAQKPPQLYCSSRCYGEAKRKRDLSWWRREGSKKRKARARISGKKGGK